MAASRARARGLGRRTEILQALPPPMSMPPMLMPPMPPMAAAAVLLVAAMADPVMDMAGEVVAEAVMDMLPISMVDGSEVVKTKR